MNETNKGKKLAVIGSRDFDNYKIIKEILQNHEPKAIISGGAKGVDSASQRYASEVGIPILIIYPRWRVNRIYNPRAGFERNTKIIEKAEEVVAIQLNKSRGTQDGIDKANKLGKKVYLYEF